MYVDLENYPRYSKTYCADFSNFTGGLNLRDLGYLVDNSESPNMRNLLWKNGSLQSRDGQTLVATPSETENQDTSVGYTCFESLFHGYAFFHIGTTIQCLPMTTAPVADGEGALPAYTVLYENVPSDRGTFFRYQDHLYYKNRGGFFQISYSSAPGLDVPFRVDDVVDIAETADAAPVIIINASPVNGSGTIYQPENRLSSYKTVRYTAVAGTTLYQLPVQNITRVVRVKVDGVVQTEGTNYSVNVLTGVVTFFHAPDPGTPITNNTVEITYAKDNPTAMRSIMSCRYAAVSGGDTNLCIVLGGCEAQPNAVFWNANDELAMQPYYFPIPCYNLVGDTEDAVTGFGKQYSDTIVLKEHSVGKLAYTVEDIDGRSTVSFGYISVNAKIGCDLPWSIQLIANNIVFCNRDQGVHVILSSSAAYENNIQCVSQKINDDVAASSTGIRGMLRDIRESDTPVVSYDDGRCYWLCTNGKVYAWDYDISTFTDPCWFYWTNIDPVALLCDARGTVYHMDSAGALTAFVAVFSDYGKAIDKLYQFPMRHFDSYDRFKHILRAVIVLRKNADSYVTVQYDTDMGARIDPMPIIIHAAEDPDSSQFGKFVVANRVPCCRNVRQFGLTVSNNRAGEDLAIAAAQVFYRYGGRDR